MGGRERGWENNRESEEERSVNWRKGWKEQVILSRKKSAEK